MLESDHWCHFPKFVSYLGVHHSRTSESQGHQQRYFSSAAFYLKSLNRVRSLPRRDFK
jgi:hypothetical protein